MYGPGGQALLPVLPTATPQILLHAWWPVVDTHLSYGMVYSTKCHILDAKWSFKRSLLLYHCFFLPSQVEMWMKAKRKKDKWIESLKKGNSKKEEWGGPSFGTPALNLRSSTVTKTTVMPYRLSRSKARRWSPGHSSGLFSEANCSLVDKQYGIISAK